MADSAVSDPAARAELRGVGTISRVVLGAMGFERLSPGRARADADYEAIFEAALARGVDTIDVAPLYGFGAAERIVGAWRARTRAPVRVITKVGLAWESDGRSGGGHEGCEVFFESRDASGHPVVVRRDSRPGSVLREIERSRERLGMERLDIVQVHHRDRRVPIDETMGALVDAWRAKKVGAVGVSSFTAADLEQASRAVERLSGGALALSCTQGLYNLLSREVESDILKVVRARSLGFLAFSPLAQGLLSGAIGPERAIDDFRAASPLFAPANRRLLASTIERELAPLARRHGVSVSALALAWVLSREGVTAVIVGAREPRQLAATLEALRLVTGDHVMDRRVLDRVGDAFAELELSLAASPLDTLRAGLRRWWR